ncbi:unnamed protein product [Chrysoparadoxa australica]
MLSAPFAQAFITPSLARTTIVHAPTQTSQAPVAIPSCSRSQSAVVLKARDDDEVPFELRVLSLAPYTLPFLDGVEKGANIYRLVPGLNQAVYGTLGPILSLWDGPFLSFGFFLGLTFLSRNPELPRYLRFNMQQAVLLDISLIIGSLLESLLKFSVGNSDAFTNFIFYCWFTSLAYCAGSNLVGVAPNQIPGVR